MKINFQDYDLTDFIVKQGEFCGVPALLITPSRLDVKWTQKNKIFRSSVWTLDGELLSGGFHKFVNYGELPEVFGKPTSLKNATILDKIDGSCMIVDIVNNQISTRTRGTLSSDIQENASDYRYALNKYPAIIDYITANKHQTLLFEIVTPNNKIVIDYGTDIEIYLIGIINKTNYELVTQKAVDLVASLIGVKRPKKYTFKTIQEVIDTVTNLKGIEGVVLYTNNDSDLFKVKSTEYITKHAFKAHASIETVLDLFLSYGRPNYNDFKVRLSESFDYECVQMVIGFISQICEAYKEVQEIEAHMQRFVLGLTNMSRKEQAAKIISAYGDTNRAGFVFMKLDNKSFTNKEYQKLLWQVLKK
jgi:hypothetical protein